MMGLRLRAGLPRDEVERILALGTRGGARRAAIARAVSDGLLEWAGDAGHDSLRVSARGALLANEVLVKLV